MSEPKVDELPTVECLYVGRRVLANGKLAEGYMPIEIAKGYSADAWQQFEAAVSLFGEAKRPKHNARAGAVVGGVYKMPVKIEDSRITTARTGVREYVRRYDDKDIVIACETRDDAANMHIRSSRIMAKLKTDQMLVQELRALRGLYKRTPWADRMALELLVLDALRNEKV